MSALKNLEHSWNLHRVKEGMVHISKLSKNRVEKVEDVVSLGDVVKVVCLGKDKMGRFSFSMKDVAE